MRAAYFHVLLQVDAANADARVWFDNVTNLVDNNYLPLLLHSLAPARWGKRARRKRERHAKVDWMEVAT